MPREKSYEKLKKVLLKRRTELMQRLGMELDDMAEHTHYSGDAADVAFESSGLEIASQLAVMESRELDQIDYALRRMKKGSYGTCIGCDCKIPLARLDALPHTPFCVKCQSEAQRDADWMESRLIEDWNKISDGEGDTSIDINKLSMDMSR